MAMPSKRHYPGAASVCRGAHTALPANPCLRRKGRSTGAKHPVARWNPAQSDLLDGESSCEGRCPLPSAVAVKGRLRDAYGVRNPLPRTTRTVDPLAQGVLTCPRATPATGLVRNHVGFIVTRRAQAGKAGRRVVRQISGSAVSSPVVQSGRVRRIRDGSPGGPAFRFIQSEIDRSPSIFDGFIARWWTAVLDETLLTCTNRLVVALCVEQRRPVCAASAQSEAKLGLVIFPEADRADVVRPRRFAECEVATARAWKRRHGVRMPRRAVRCPKSPLHGRPELSWSGGFVISRERAQKRTILRRLR